MAPWNFYNSSGEALTSFGPVALTDLDIDGGTAIGEAVVGADLFIADNGAGGTNVKVTATEIATFIAAPAQANQTAIEAETNQDTYIPPDLMKHHPGVAKVTCLYEQAGAHGITGSYNMESTIDGGAAGDSDHLFNVHFSDDNWQIAGCVENGGIFNQGTRVSTGAGFNAITRNTSNSGTDYSSPGAAYSVFGDQ